MTPEIQFERELEIFRTEVEAGTQFFYAHLAVHAVAADHKPVYNLLNQVPLFWNTCLGALQTASFIALGRVFDRKSAHNLNRVLGIAQHNPEIFSKMALGRRKKGNDPEPLGWLDEYLRDAYEPTPMDFRRIRAHILKRRKIYESNYRDLRNKVFAHKEVSDQAGTAALFGKTNIRELQRLFAFLGSLHEALWQLFFNGRKPVLRPLRYSVKRMRDLLSPATRRKVVQEEITHEAEQFLMSALGRGSFGCAEPEGTHLTSDSGQRDQTYFDAHKSRSCDPLRNKVFGHQLRNRLPLLLHCAYLPSGFSRT